MRVFSFELTMSSDGYHVHINALILYLISYILIKYTIDELRRKRITSPKQLGDKFVDKIKETLSGGKQTKMLFVLDESGSVSKDNFQMEIDFFPSSGNRGVGLITFSNIADADIPLSTADTSDFLAATENITHEKGQGIEKAREALKKEMESNDVDSQTLVFLITDGQTDTDPASEVEDLTNLSKD